MERRLSMEYSRSLQPRFADASTATLFRAISCSCSTALPTGLGAAMGGGAGGGGALARQAACMCCGVENHGCVGGDANGQPMPSGIAATAVNSCIGFGGSGWSGERSTAFVGIVS